MSGIGGFPPLARVHRTLKIVWEGLLDLVYPPRCLICDRYDTPVVCEDCHAAFLPLSEPLCEVCGHSIEPPVSCSVCAMAAEHGGWGFDRARAAGIYQGPLRAGVHAIKYDRHELLGEALGAYLANRCVVEGVLPGAVRADIEVVLPVPLHRSRERWRGYNQARLLAAPLAEVLNVPLLPDVMIRVRKTAPQVERSGQERRRSLVPECFAVPEAASVAGKGILLVDDVMTTGATVSACAKALKAAGARRVYVVTLAAGG
jgi:ComF family protein